MLSKIRDILIIVNKGQIEQYKKLLQDGKNLGIRITYQEQIKPRGLPDAFILGEKLKPKESESACWLKSKFSYELLLEFKEIPPARCQVPFEIVFLLFFNEHLLRNPTLFERMKLMWLLGPKCQCNNDRILIL